ncbi:hypothetical protein B7R54_08330 [Subtercola boreus]|uniref:Thioredoxin domain-containing protein n=1 Tax=Subtercola boreus TaxID=120213 RepID=A0A3E0VHN3_9MICO|nr:thioredoxin family protein [Subtercola boreus]RFA09231.1 hypothetical protein B7R54_08330 [Subtercola boreus]TQL53744.1 thiol-disulfide isomerase/thioredoxin [Subtercola boreus]
MDPLVVVILLASLVVVATGLGLLHRHLRGRARPARGEEIVDFDGLTLGENATLLQFSSEVCAPCVATHRVLEAVARDHPGTRHVDIDITDRPELAERFNLLQTPTTLVLDARGALRARIGGSVRRDVLLEQLARVLNPSTTSQIGPA